MEIENPLTLQFLSRNPVEAARVLEQLSAQDVSALLMAVPHDMAENVLAAMLPGPASTVVNAMDNERGAELLNEIPVSNSARIYNLLGQEKQKALSEHLGTKNRKRIRRVLGYRSLSAGDLMNPNVDMLLENLTVADAIRRIERHRQTVKCEIYVVDTQHRYLGVVDLGKLLTARQQIRLRDIMNRSVSKISVNASSESLLLSPIWKGRQRLPVVESDNTLVGILDYQRVKDAVDRNELIVRDPMENLFSLVGLYWLSLVHLLDSILNIAVDKRETHHER